MDESNQALAGPRSRTKAGVAQACAVCHQRKIKCDMSAGKDRCTNCSLYNTECLPRLRKRKRRATVAFSEEIHEKRNSVSSRQPLHGIPVPVSPSSSLSVAGRGMQSESLQGRDFLSLNDAAPVTTRATRSTLIRSPGNPRGTSKRRRNGDEEVVQEEEEEEEEQDREPPKDTPTGVAHDGKAIYFGHIEGRVTEATKAYPQTTTMSPAELTSLEQSGAFDFPSRALKDCFTDNFFKYCYPWAPVVESSWLLETPTRKPSALLVQAVLLAGSRVTSPNDLAVSAEIYQRAKALFFSNYETNPVRRIIACLLLRWWCPAGQDRVCMDSSHFWIGTGVRIAIAIGLNSESSDPRDASYRRRLWWSLIAHDSQLSIVHGWPSSIHREDHSASLPDSRDFPRNASSTAFVTMSRIFGEMAHMFRRKGKTATAMEKLQNALYVWIRELPDQLRLFHLNPAQGLIPYHFEGRQLHVMFFVNVILLFRQQPTASTESLSVESLLAASFVAGLYEEFLIRDDLNHIGLAIHKFFLFAAGMTLLSARRTPTLTSLAAEDYNTIIKALEHFSIRYPSAKGTIRMLQNMEGAQEQAEAGTHTITIVPRQANVPSLFREFGPELCRQWHLAEISNPIIHKQGSQAKDAASRPLPNADWNHEVAVDPSTGHCFSNQITSNASQLFGADDPYDPSFTDIDAMWPYNCPGVSDSSDWILGSLPFDMGSAPTLT